MERVEIVEGWTGAIDFQLTEDGTPANLTGDTVTAEARDKTRTAVTLTGDLTVTSATSGKVRINPDTGDFPASRSPYELRFKRVSGGLAVWYPQAEAIVLDVRPWIST